MITYENDMNLDTMTFNQVNRDYIREVGVIHFQNGPIKEYGENGVDMITALSAMKDRLCKLNLSYYCQENSNAIEHLEEAIEELENRKKDRISRGVEGLNKE